MVDREHAGADTTMEDWIQTDKAMRDKFKRVSVTKRLMTRNPPSKKIILSNIHGSVPCLHAFVQNLPEATKRSPFMVNLSRSKTDSIPAGTEHNPFNARIPRPAKEIRN